MKATEVDDIIANLDQQLAAEAVDQELDEAGPHARRPRGARAPRCCCSRRCRQAWPRRSSATTQLQQIYEDEILRFTTIEALHILVEAEAEAQDVYDQVTAPGATQKTFEGLAKEVSTDTRSEPTAAASGQAVASTYVPEFGEAAVALEPGEISEPVAERVRLARDLPRGQAGHARSTRRRRSWSQGEQGDACSTSGCATRPRPMASR